MFDDTARLRDSERRSDTLHRMWIGWQCAGPTSAGCRPEPPDKHIRDRALPADLRRRNGVSVIVACHVPAHRLPCAKGGTYHAAVRAAFVRPPPDGIECEYRDITPTSSGIVARGATASARP